MERRCGRLLRSLAATAAATDGGRNASLSSTYRQFLSHGSLSSQIRQSRPFPFRESAPSKYLSAPSDCPPAGLGLCNLLVSPFQFLGKTNRHWGSNSRADWMNKGLSRSEGIFDQFICHSRQCTRVASLHDPSQLSKVYARHAMLLSIRALSSTSSSHSSERTTSEESRKDLTTSEDPFDAPTYNIPEKPVTFTEGASYSVVILLGLGIAAAAAYAVFKELIFEPKEYKIFGKALERVQNDSQVRVRIGSPVTGYGQESRNRAARQRIPHKTWTDEDGVEHVEVSFFVRGPHGAGRVYSEMFRHKDDKQWKFTYLIVDIMSPSQSRLMLESYIPA